jgi:hypothetical protein
LKPGHQDAPGGALEPSPAIPSRPIQHSTTNCRKYSNIIFQPIIQPMIQLYPTQKQFASPGGRFVPPGIVDSRCNDHGPGVQKIRTLWNCCVFPIWMSQSNDVKWCQMMIFHESWSTRCLLFISCWTIEWQVNDMNTFKDLPNWILNPKQSSSFWSFGKMSACTLRSMWDPEFTATKKSRYVQIYISRFSWHHIRMNLVNQNN